ncbi:MAG TPA: hypothetical protein VM032_00175 [Vicinamibacterales bacterium]|nr:hypothetical protein [Vicinamibacterales bacterium]
MHTSTRRGKPGRSRVLYWYRTPPGVRIGRKPFDEELQRTLEQQNPGVSFDWNAIISTPMPPPDMTEYWRERRRAEKVARQERRASEAEDTGEPALAQAGEEPGGADNPLSDPTPIDEAPTAGEAVGSVARDAAMAGERPGDAEGSTTPKKRRRRRGGKRRRSPGESTGTAAAGADGADQVAGEPDSILDEHDSTADEPGEDQDQSGLPDLASEEE